jgi:hypothetical protein
VGTLLTFKAVSDREEQRHWQSHVPLLAVSYSILRVGLCTSGSFGGQAVAGLILVYGVPAAPSVASARACTALDRPLATKDFTVSILIPLILASEMMPGCHKARLWNGDWEDTLEPTRRLFALGARIAASWCGF